jgi:hypothetical protein
LLIEKFLQTLTQDFNSDLGAGSSFYLTGLQWTKLRRRATLQCNVDRINGGSLTVEIPRKTNEESTPWISICAARQS